jgi:hypothetical protein
MCIMKQPDLYKCIIYLLKDEFQPQYIRMHPAVFLFKN